MTAGKGEKIWKLTEARKMALLTSICIIIRRVRTNESEN
jgi:hypothetical protein